MKLSGFFWGWNMIFKPNCTQFGWSVHYTEMSRRKKPDGLRKFLLQICIPLLEKRKTRNFAEGMTGCCNLLDSKCLIINQLNRFKNLPKNCDWYNTCLYLFYQYKTIWIPSVHFLLYDWNPKARLKKQLNDSCIYMKEKWKNMRVHFCMIQILNIPKVHWFFIYKG